MCSPCATAGRAGAARPRSPRVVLVCPENFSNQPDRRLLDVRKQLTVLRRQLARLARIEDLLAQLPPDLTFDLDPDRGVPRRPAAELAAAIGQVAANYAPECLATCEMCYFCRDEARGTTARSAGMSATTSAAWRRARGARPGRRHAAGPPRRGRGRRAAAGGRPAAQGRPGRAA